MQFLVPFLLGVGLIAWFLQLWLLDGATQEGFAILSGTVPVAKQASFIPGDVAGATTSRPDLAKPEIRDWIDARDSLLYFLEAYDPAVVADSGADPVAVKKMVMEAPVALAKIEAYILDPESVPSRDILETAVEARALADLLRRVGPMDPAQEDIFGTVRAQV
jgi:hypothetical protein